MGGFFGMKGASALGCGNDWTGPSETRQVRTSFQDQRTGMLRMQRTMASPFPPPAPEEAQRTQMGSSLKLGKEISCTTCEAKKKALREAGWNPPAVTTRMRGGYPLQNGSRRPYLGGKSYDDEDLGCASCGLEGARRQAASLGQVCARKKPVGLNCQKTAAGDVVCSDGIVYAGDCPNVPDVTIPGIADVNPGTNTPKTPPAPGTDVSVPPSSAGIPLPVGSAPSSAGAPADSGMSPLAIGAVALVGLGIVFIALK